MVEEPGNLIVSGTITRFYVDWKDEGGRSFEFAADYTVQSGERPLFSWHCSSVEKGSNMLVQDEILIRMGMADCMRLFIEAAQKAKILSEGV